MTILVYKDGRLLIDNEQPLEGVSLDNLAAILSGASDGDVIQYDATKGMWVNKSAPSSLPEVTASDKGKYLKANESTGDPEWASGGSSGGGVLVVNVTYDEATWTYTADKTAGEIVNAMPLVYVTQTLTGSDDEEITAYVRFSMDGNGNPAYGYKEGTGYYFYYVDEDYNDIHLTAATLDDYPTYDSK